ncbi:hypothetical protein BJF84_01515 [Rhodococcus sp. CUA-806]|nr:hypothetical protein BJF84_01515 [Rhodococcus sp. CUA-806]
MAEIAAGLPVDSQLNRTPARALLSSNAGTSAVPGCGEFSARTPSLRSTPSIPRISFSASRAVAPMASNSAAALGDTSSIR